MLVSIFGIWMIAANIALLVPEKDGCNVKFVSGGGYGSKHLQMKFTGRTCKEVADEVNKGVGNE